MLSQIRVTKLGGVALKQNLLTWNVLVAILSVGAMEAIAAEQPAAQAAQPAAPAPPPVIYRPAKGSAPAARVTGGSRGTGGTSISLDVLAPDQTGLTTEEQPSLFWYQSGPAPARFELTLLEDNKPKPVLQVKVDKASKAGVQRLRLADHGVKLMPGVEYQWVVALVLDPNNRSGDLVASGFVQRVEASPDLKAKISSAAPSALPGIYAEAGIWHDALAKLSDLIDAQPDNQSLRKQRADLLRQVGLKKAADSESAPAPK